MTTSPSENIVLEEFSVKPMDDFAVIAKDSHNMMDVGTVLLYNCLELHGLVPHGQAIQYSYRTFIFKPGDYHDGGAFYFQVAVDPPHCRLLRYKFPFDLWEPSLMAFAIATQVLFLAGPRPYVEGENLPAECLAAGLDGVSSTLETLHGAIDGSIKKHGGLLVQIGEQTWNIVQALYVQNTLRSMVRRPPHNKLN